MITALLLPFLGIFILLAFRFILSAPKRKRETASRRVALQRGLRIAGVFILAAGLYASLSVYRNAASAPDDDSDIIGYDIENGQSYPIRSSESKSYNYQRQLMGGKAAVFMDDLTQWYRSLWHGRNLAAVLAIFSFGGLLACFLWARFLA